MKHIQNTLIIISNRSLVSFQTIVQSETTLTELHNCILRNHINKCMVIYNVQLFFKRLSDQHNFFHMKNCVELYWFLYVWRADYMYLSFPFSLILLWLFQESVSFWNRNKPNIVKKVESVILFQNNAKYFFLMCKFGHLKKFT